MASALHGRALDVKDIKTLKQEKGPKSANQMAAVVAYYLSELSPAAERKQAITKEDITKFFKQAGFPLPQRPEATLKNARNAGYFDPAGEGSYKLNPVGYNLVVHGLPQESRTPTLKPRRRKRNSRTKA